MVLRKGGAIDALAGIVRRAFVEHGESTTTEPTLIIALVGLLNLSLHVDNQVPIAHKSLAMLLRFNKVRAAPVLRAACSPRSESTVAPSKTISCCVAATLCSHEFVTLREPFRHPRCRALVVWRFRTCRTAVSAQDAKSMNPIVSLVSHHQRPPSGRSPISPISLSPSLTNI